MGYKRMKPEHVFEIFRRYHSGQRISEIRDKEGWDRKTIRYYIKKLHELGFTRDKLFPDKDALYQAIAQILPKNDKPKELYDELSARKEVIMEMITHKSEPLKPKTAWEVLMSKGEIKSSYETFKVFMRKEKISLKIQKQIIRIELPPGQEVQLDYGSVGVILDKKTGKMKKVNAFCMKLSHSRFLFIQFVFSQDEASFTNSVIDGFEYYGGVTVCVNLDNLKAGVIKADTYDPLINKTFADAAQHYKFFADPCKAYYPKGKAKIERIIPMAREQFRKLKRLHPDAGLEELNKAVLEWCRFGNGMKDHGTTGLKPLEVYETVEKATLLKLPDQRLELSIWKDVKVHPDQFIQFEKKRYSLPAKYRGDQLWAKKCGKTLEIFDKQYEKIRQYTIPVRSVVYDKMDFPEGKREFMTGEYWQYLVEQAKGIGETAEAFMLEVLKTKAYLNTRRGQGILAVMKEYREKSYFGYVCGKAKEGHVKLPQVFKKMMEQEEDQIKLNFDEVKISEKGKDLIRDINYYLN